ncbi:DeoR/GlpR family DNA-binding transcription regulator [Nakamurella aerolata]|uniref:DeoR/GlpR transcriptional regulator n=1 Tax=Nakamurella aerolata TaxID=1656892 RepID=A0A849A865_9ACTN|nr:DeoR/GlpR family DNA-binding transcription regulator [Nakamurella aerolata]NNG36749.1 DeoR/GlpR transcriptional regulator [Nakamurella aerolata]
MLAAVRQARIIDEVRRTGGVRVADLTELLGVSDMTVRRDLDALDRKGLLTKVHGGATALDTASAIEPSFETKRARERPEKQAIAAHAAKLIRPGMAIAISAGTTTWALAPHLAAIGNLTVVTNSLKVAEALYDASRPDLTVVLTGGLRTPSDGLVGPVAVQAIRSLHVDLLVMGVHGIDIRAGLTTPNLLEAETNRAMVDSAKRVAVVADHTKWGVVGLSHIAPLSVVDTLLIDENLPDEATEALAKHVGEIVAVHDPEKAHRVSAESS